MIFTCVRRVDALALPSQALTAKMTGRILKAAREQQDEVEAEDHDAVLGKGLGGQLASGALAAALRQQADSSDDDDDDDVGEGMIGRRTGGDVQMKAPQGRRHVGSKVDDDDDDDDIDAELRARTLSALGSGGEQVRVCCMKWEIKWL